MDCAVAGAVKADQISAAAISQVDLSATLAALTGQELANGSMPDSFNELSALLGESKQGRAWVIEHAGSLSIVQGGWKLISPSSGPKVDNNTHTELGNDPKPQLYHMAVDPSEKQDLASQEPDRVRALSELLQKIKANARPI